MKSLPKRQQAQVEGHALSYTMSGSGRPTLVLINGAGGPIEGWFRLYPAIEQLGTVLAYDRPGVGASGPPRVPQTGRAVVGLLRGLLERIGATPPYVLVAHSFGGLHAQLFARLHPDEVAGVVFLEATAPQDVGSIKQHQGAGLRVLHAVLGRFARRHPFDEVAHEVTTVQELATAPAFPQVPVCVVSGAKRPPSFLFPPEAARLRQQHQQGLASLSSKGQQVIATSSGHFPQMSQPELVLRVIAEVAAAAR
ncbi:alpha/beta hydrolase [Aquabacterium sp. A7-Y]|uniref:alpha/beta fold hydrolase n=1 Tax=Aquabacterium sp. A7-Y TaxID=1349605 RepID=UPI00223CCABF|nr:alpha/beta hydrolase [Aquabacterium sp. A7-Y]MCW7538046.1 alpha/beta hydrolase [Aquabacterium sp. A7-Y]